MEPYVKLIANAIQFLGYSAWGVPGLYILQELNQKASSISLEISVIYGILGLLIHSTAWYTLYWDCKRKGRNQTNE